MSRYVRSNFVVSRVIAGETLIVPIRAGVGELNCIYSLNEVATSIWETIAKPRTQEEIVHAIKQEYDGQLANLEQDVVVFLTEMQSAGLVAGAPL